jgi:hypothetical protein
VGHIENAVEVGTDDIPPLVRRHLVEHAIAGNTGVIHEDIRWAMGLFNGCHTRFAGLVIADVPFERGYARFLRESRRRRVIAGIGRGYLTTIFLQANGDCLADPASPAGDDSCFLMSIAHCGLLLVDRCS